VNRFPSLFVSHGAPTFALEPGLAGPQLAQLGRTLARPRAVLVVSPHWMTRTVAVATAARPKTIHDFGGFPSELYQIQYPAPGHPEVAQAAADLLAVAGHRVTVDPQRGLDHGTWVPLRHMFPAADVPVFQVSMPASLDAASAWQLGAALAPLSVEGVLIVGSGSLTHNLYEFRQGHDHDEAYASEFVDWVRSAVVARDQDLLVHALARAPHAQRAHPTTEHFLPLLVAAGAAATDAPVTVLPGGITHGVLSMESYLFGHVDAACVDAPVEQRVLHGEPEAAPLRA
jgi:4,5-DOPA dioxygenase extradiol